MRSENDGILLANFQINNNPWFVTIHKLIGRTDACSICKVWARGRYVFMMISNSSSSKEPTEVLVKSVACPIHEDEMLQRWVSFTISLKVFDDPYSLAPGQTEKGLVLELLSKYGIQISEE